MELQDENKGKITDIEGAEDLATGTFSADAAQSECGHSFGGKVKFTVTPKGEGGAMGSSRPTRFFFKVKMK